MAGSSSLDRSQATSMDVCKCNTLLWIKPLFELSPHLAVVAAQAEQASLRHDVPHDDIGVLRPRRQLRA